MQLCKHTYVKQRALASSARPVRPLRLRRAAPAGKQETSSSALLTDIEVTFQIPNRVLFGQHICITGGCNQLGNWDPSNAVPMEWTEGDIWVTACQLPKGDTVDYKYIIKSEFTSHILWQAGSNMVIELPEAVIALEVRDSWNGQEHVILCVQPPGSSTPASPIAVDELLVSPGPLPVEGSTIPPVSLPTTADTDALANNLLAKAMDEELVKTSIESMPLEKIKEMMTQHGLPPSGRKEQMVDQLKQQLSKNGVASSKA